jgi:hypothetical protein
MQAHAVVHISEDEPGVATCCVYMCTIKGGGSGPKWLQHVAIDVGLVRDPAAVAVYVVLVMGPIFADKVQLSAIGELAAYDFVGERPSTERLPV